MEKADLLKYLNDCKDLEVTYYNLSKEQSNLKERVESLGIAHKIGIPDKKRIKKKVDDESYITVLSILLAVMFIMLIIFIIIAIITFRSHNFLKAIFFIIIEGIFGMLILLVIAAIVKALLVPLMEKPEVNRQYQIALQNYQLEVQRDNERVKNERRQAQIIQSRIDELEVQKNSTLEALNKLYDVGIIYTKYQALVPVVMFCEYIESGRCSQLEGNEGAYNIYESELRKNIIIDKLDVVVNKLEQIKENQPMLYEVIEQGNQKVSQLCSATYENAKRLENIQNDVAISAENSRVTAQNTRVLAEIEAYKLLCE